MADEKLNVSPEENPQPSLFDAGPEGAPAQDAPALEPPPQPRDATRAEKEEIVYLKLSELFPFKDHPFGVRDDAEMKGLVESVKNREKQCKGTAWQRLSCYSLRKR